MAEAADGLDDIRAYNSSPGPRCGTGIALNAMDPALRDKVLRASADPSIENKAIIRWLKDTHSIQLSKESFQRHAKRECRCGR